MAANQFRLEHDFRGERRVPAAAYYGVLTQGELYKLGLLTTGLCLLVFLALGTPWLLFVAG